MILEMTRERALQLGLLTCNCGHPENNHFHDRTMPGSCAHCDCQKYRETGVKGVIIQRSWD